MTADVTIIGGGLAGSEAAWQLAQRGHRVRLVEMRPRLGTAAHKTGLLAELVCSNSMGSTLPDRALGILKGEMLRLGSLIIRCAYRNAIPAGSALGISREDFSRQVTEALDQHACIDVVREEAQEVPAGSVILASGPLTSEALCASLQALTGQQHLHFFDAMAPIVTAESIDLDLAFRQNRWDRGPVDGLPSSAGGDYINCPLSQEQYDEFLRTLLAAPRAELKSFELELERYFEGCMPIEVLAARGQKALTFGPMRPVGLRDPRTGQRPFAVVQLRQDDLAGTLYNLVGFQTNLRWGAQAELLRTIPGLGRAEFVRLGQMHRNTFINSPQLLHATLQMKSRADLFLAGQITGTEGYVGSTLGGLVSGINMARNLAGLPLLTFPISTMAGALLHYVTHAEPKRFQPMKANLGLLPDLEKRTAKRERGAAHAARARDDLERFLKQVSFVPAPEPPTRR